MPTKYKRVVYQFRALLTIIGQCCSCQCIHAIMNWKIPLTRSSAGNQNPRTYSNLMIFYKCGKVIQTLTGNFGGLFNIIMAES
jgi:hypothetical protein